MDFFVSELEKLNELGKIREGLNSYNHCLYLSATEITEDTEKKFSVISVAIIFAL